MAQLEKVELNMDPDTAMQADFGYFALDLRTGNVTDWHGTLLAAYPPYIDGGVVKIDRATADAITSGEINRDEIVKALRLGETVESFLAAHKGKANAGKANAVPETQFD